MKKTTNRCYEHKGWNIYQAGPLPGFPKKYVMFPPDLFPGDRYEMPSLAAAERLINGLLAVEALKAREKEAAEWIEIDLEE